jgi:hypothetical protein
MTSTRWRFFSERTITTTTTPHIEKGFKRYLHARHKMQKEPKFRKAQNEKWA